MCYNKYNNERSVIIGFTISYDVSVKCKKQDVKGLIHHNAREVDMMNGLYLNHSNECIDSDKTENNQTYFYNQKKGCFEKCTDVQQIYDSLNERLKCVKRTLRKDAVVLRSMVLQLDPKWYEEHHSEQERLYSYDCMIDWVCDTFGENNIISFSIHEDETNPHIHVSFCPVTADGRLSQKDFIDKFKLKQQHQSLRKYMIERGFDIDLENRKSEEYTRRLSVEEYKDLAELRAEQELLDSSFHYNVQKDKELQYKETDLSSREKTLRQKETMLADHVQTFLIESERIWQKLMELVDEYWMEPDAEDSLVNFVKKCSSHGTPLYDIYLKQQKAEKEKVDKRMLKQKEQLEHFRDITRKSYYSDYNNSLQLS